MEKWGRGRGRGRGRSAPPPTRHCTNPLPVKHLTTIQDGGIENLVYLAFRAKITPALQASIVKAVISIYRRGEEKPIERYKARISVTEDSTKQGIEKSEFQ